MSIYDMVYIATIPIYVLSVYMLFVSFFQIKIVNNKWQILYYSIYTCILVGAYILGAIPIVTSLLNIIMFFLLSLTYKNNIWFKILIILIIYTILLVTETISSVLIGYMKVTAFIKSDYDSTIGIIVSRIIHLIASYLILKLKTYMKKEHNIPAYYHVLFSLVLFGIMYLFINSMNDKSLEVSQVLISSVVMVLTISMMLFVDKKVYDYLTVYAERNILKQQTISYENQKEIIDQSLNTVKSLKHDMKNQLLTLTSIYEKNENVSAKEYSEKILNTINDASSLADSNNFIIDSVINFKLQELQNQNVEIKLNINIPIDVKILAYDLTVVLGNVLDNAITAIKDTEQEKYLSVNISCSKGNLVILIDNSYNGNLNIENGEIITTKKFKANHGVGLQNVRKTLDKYGGEIDIKYTNSKFHVAIIIPFAI